VTHYASVYPLVTTRALARPFTYEVPEDVVRGDVVSVRLGGARQRGVVIDLEDAPPEGVEAAPIERVVESLPAPLVELALWLADYYGSTPGRALALVAPAKRARRKELPQPAERDALDGEPEPQALTAAQERALARIGRAYDGGGGHFLLYGATGSGKTEVYLQAAATALDRDLGVIVLVPEIALAPQTVGRFRARFGDRVAILHSSLSEAERRDERERIASGAAPIVIGARSAVFAPLPRLGLICVDEEHDAGYKQESDPRYDARTVAAKRASLEGAVAIYGSATPRPESWERLERLELGERIGVRRPRRCSRSWASSPRAGARRSFCSTAAASRPRCTAAPAARRGAARIATSHSSCTTTRRCTVTTAGSRRSRPKAAPPAARWSSRGSAPGRNGSNASWRRTFPSSSASASTPTRARSPVSRQ
jgi:primosomal protein N' (replication factor Y)